MNNVWTRVIPSWEESIQDKQPSTLRRSCKLLVFYISLMGILFFIRSINSGGTYQHVIQLEYNNAVSESANDERIDVIAECQSEYWSTFIAKHSSEFIDATTKIIPEEITFAYFIVGKEANHEFDQSITCLKKKFGEDINITKYEHSGDDIGQQHGPTRQKWNRAMATKVSHMMNLTSKLTVFMDADVFANPDSILELWDFIVAMKNHDLGYAYKYWRNHKGIHRPVSPNGGFVMLRNTVNTYLFMQCVQKLIMQSNFTITEQTAYERVLQMDVGAFLRVRMLPAEWQCRGDRFIDQKGVKWRVNFTLPFGPIFKAIDAYTYPDYEEIGCFFVHYHLRRTNIDACLES